MGPPTALVALFGMPGWAELLLVAFVGLLLFGKRLPEVARSVGQSVVEFKKGMQGFKQEVDPAANLPPAPRSATPTLPERNPPPAAPGQQSTE